MTPARETSGALSGTSESTKGPVNGKDVTAAADLTEAAILSKKGKIPVMELFGPVVQGEGELAGLLSYFIRTGGCDLRCSWCDTMHAVDPDQVHEAATWMTQEQTLKAFLSSKPVPKSWVTISGGNPLLWDLDHLVTGLREADFQIAVETQGTIFADWLSGVDLITCSPKGPSSGMQEKFNQKVLEEYYRNWTHKMILKVVIFSKEDLDFAEQLKEKFPVVPFFLSAGTPPPAPGETYHRTCDRVLESYRYLTLEFLKRPKLYGARILPQLHVLVHGHLRGV